MSPNVSDRLRDALEQLDQAIDRLDARVTIHLEALEAQTELHAASPPVDKTTERELNPALAERLDRIIQRLELALSE
jgi:hypothetical protein